MKKCLYFICPTDCLESTIQSTFHQENFFYSSLGNSVNFNECELNQAKQLICDKGIREISFILADDFMKIFAEVLRKYHFRKTLNVIIQGILNLLKDGYIKFHDPDYKFNDSQSLALNRKNMLISICKKHGIKNNLKCPKV